jgi:hypothetical protein
MRYMEPNVRFSIDILVMETCLKSMLQEDIGPIVVIFNACFYLRVCSHDFLHYSGKFDSNSQFNRTTLHTVQMIFTFPSHWCFNEDLTKSGLD